MEEFLDIFFGLLFIFWWFVCLKLLSGKTGWETLAGRYEFKGKFNGNLLRCEGPGRSTHIGANEEGLYFARVFPFRPFHKTLLVPWQEIKPERSRYLVRKGYKLMFPEVPEAMKKPYFGFTFFLLDKTFKKLATCVPEEIEILLSG